MWSFVAYILCTRPKNQNYLLNLPDHQSVLGRDIRDRGKLICRLKGAFMPLYMIQCLVDTVFPSIKTMVN